MDSFAAEKGGEKWVVVLGGWWTGRADCWMVGWLATGQWLVLFIPLLKIRFHNK